MPEKDIDKYKTWLEASHIKHKRWVRDVTAVNREFYRGNQWDDLANKDRYKDLVVDNIIFSNIATIIPSIFSRNPQFTVEPRSRPRLTKDGQITDPLTAAKLWNLVDEYYIEQLGFAREVRRAMYDAELSPWGIMEIGYTLKTEKFFKNDKNKLLEVNELIKAESPFMSRVSPLDFRVDVESTDHLLRTANWVAKRWVKPLEDVKANKQFSNTANLQENFVVKTRDNDFSEVQSTEMPGAWERVEGWDIWDKKNQRLITLVESHDKLLRDEKWPLEYEGFPFEILYYIENPDQTYPISPTTLDVPHQRELNWISSLQLSHIRKAANTKGFLREGAIENEAEIDQLIDGPPSTVVTVKGDPNTAYSETRAPNVSQDVYIIRRQLKNDNREMRGIADFEKGGATNFDTAAEPQLISQGIGIRRSDRREQAEDFMTRCMRKFNQVVVQTVDKVELRLTDAQVNNLGRTDLLDKIAGPQFEALLPWLSVDVKDLQGEFDFKIRPGSTEADDTQRIQGEAFTVYQNTLQNLLVDQEDNTRQFLTAFNKDPEEMMRPKEEVQQEQQAASQAQQQAIASQDDKKHQTDLTKTQMKTQSAEKIASTKAQASALIESLKG